MKIPKEGECVIVSIQTIGVHSPPLRFATVQDSRGITHRAKLAAFSDAAPGEIRAFTGDPPTIGDLMSIDGRSAR